MYVCALQITVLFLFSCNIYLVLLFVLLNYCIRFLKLTDCVLSVLVNKNDWSLRLCIDYDIIQFVILFIISHGVETHMHLYMLQIISDTGSVLGFLL